MSAVVAPEKPCTRGLGGASATCVTDESAKESKSALPPQEPDGPACVLAAHCTPVAHVQPPMCFL